MSLTGLKTKSRPAQLAYIKLDKQLRKDGGGAGLNLRQGSCQGPVALHCYLLLVLCCVSFLLLLYFL